MPNSATLVFTLGMLLCAAPWPLVLQYHWSPLIPGITGEDAEVHSAGQG